jgi:hypothetical protein
MAASAVFTGNDALPSPVSSFPSAGSTYTLRIGVSIGDFFGNSAGHRYCIRLPIAQKLGTPKGPRPASPPVFTDKNSNAITTDS